MFQTATIGAAHSACFIGSNVPSSTSQSSSFLPSPGRNTRHCLPYNTLEWHLDQLLSWLWTQWQFPGLALYFNLKCSLIPTYYIRATMLFCKARSVPYAMKVKVEEELEQLVKQGSWSLWSLQSGLLPSCQWWNLHICGDFRLTINKASKLDQYPIPRIDLFATLNGEKTFTKLDMRQAYQQLPLDEESKAYT